MDLLGDIGNADQLTSAREENKVLNAKVKDLKMKIYELQVENQALKAEVEMYRAEVALPSFSKLALGESKENADAMDEDVCATDDFVTSGNGVYPSDPAVSLPNLHGVANPLCCALHPDDSLLATGGADAHISLCRWGGALAPSPSAVADAVGKAERVRCNAPVICTAFSQENRGMSLPVVAAGCMDGSVQLVGFGPSGVGAQPLKPSTKGALKHVKYVKHIAWSPNAPILASASADGTIQLTWIGQPNSDGEVQLETRKTMHLSGPVEALCFLGNGDTLCCYERGTSHLTYFDLKEECKLTKYSLNNSGSSTGGFDDHVSFAVMSLAASPNNGGKYIAAATDTSRNMILEAGSSRQVRNLYGHKNDGFSQPKIAWSSSGQYLFGNTQEDSSLCVWDIASSSIVKRLDNKNGGHTGQIRDIFSSKTTDTLVTASFDKTARVWLCGLGMT